MDPLAFDGIDAEITVTQSTSSDFAVAIQLTGPTGEDLKESRAVKWYLSKNSDGSTLATTSTDVTTLAAGTDGVVIEDDSNVSGWAVSESDGDIDFAIAVPSTKVVYLVLVMPGSGRLVISDAMTYGM